MAVGLAKKLSVQPDDAVVLAKIESVQIEKQVLQEKAKAEAASLLRVLEQDPAEQLWHRVNAAYRAFVAPLQNEFRLADRGIGETRNTQGSGFEEWVRQDAFEVVVSQLPPPTDGWTWQRHDNWNWVNGRGKAVGEVDVVVAQHREADDDVQPVALLELKAHCLDVPSGWWQQVRQQRAGLHLQLPSSLARHQYRKTIKSSNVPVYVVSTLPFHRFVMGAQMDLVQRLGRHFGNEYRGVSPKVFPHERDPGELKNIANHLREEMGLGDGCDPVARQAPVDFIRNDASARVIFIV